MKTFILMLAISSFAFASEATPIQKYRKEYSSLISQWSKEQSPQKRALIEKKIQSLKTKNERLFAK
jgi:hypothetical protein